MTTRQHGVDGFVAISALLASCATHAAAPAEEPVVKVAVDQLGPCQAESLVAVFQGLGNASWSAVVCADVDHDGINDVAVQSNPRAIQDERSTWILSSRTWRPCLRVIGRAREGHAPLLSVSTVADVDLDGVPEIDVERSFVVNPTEAGPTGETSRVLSGDRRVVESDWQTQYIAVPQRVWNYAREPKQDTWQGADFGSDDPALLPLASRYACNAAQRAFPAAKVLPIVGDLDGDGCADMLAVETSSSRVFVISGADYHVLRDMHIAPDRIGIAWVEAQAIGDLNRDGVPDVLVCGRVTQTASDLAPHEVLLGTAAVVSGASGKPLRVLVAETVDQTLVAGCPVLRLPE
jgi:hypothetical protein